MINRRHFLTRIGYSALFAPSLASWLSSCDSGIEPGNSGTNLTYSLGRTSTGLNLSSDAILINNNFLGPVIRVQQGETLNVTMQNDMPEITNIHWHGLTVPANMDGHPMDTVVVGGSFNYRFPIIDRPGTYWYHAHPDMLTAKQAYLGHAGFLLISSPEEEALGLPNDANDIPLVIQDKRLDPAGGMIYAPTKLDKIFGWLGDQIFVNGARDTTIDVSQELYRLRVLNGSNARVYKLGFADSKTFQLIATDGGLLNTAALVDHAYISPGERVDIVVNFATDEIGTSRILKSLAFPFESTHQNYDYPQGKEFDLVRFEIKSPKSKEFNVPTSLLPYERMEESQAVKTRTFTLVMDHDTEKGMHRINDILFEMHRVDYQVKLGDLEVWEFVNEGDSLHNMHVHGTQFQVLDRSSGPLEATDRGWKDTVIVWPNERVRIIVRFTIYKGIYLLHCHNLEHEDDGMMVNLEVI